MVASGIASEWNGFGPEEVAPDENVGLGSGWAGSVAGEASGQMAWAAKTALDEVSLIDRRRLSCDCEVGFCSRRSWTKRSI